jgi:hypothetical protein
MVCFQYGDVDYQKISKDRAELEQLILWLYNTGGCINGHNVSFDVIIIMQECPRLIPVLFDMLEQGRVICTAQHERLWRIATGQSFASSDGLAALVLKYFGVTLDKTEQTKFEKVAHLPVHQWPERFRRYGRADVYWPARLLQDVYLERAHRYLLPETTNGIDHQVRTQVAGDLASGWGFVPNQAVYRSLLDEWTSKLHYHAACLGKLGYIRSSKADYVLDAKALKALAIKHCQLHGIPLKEGKTDFEIGAEVKNKLIAKNDSASRTIYHWKQFSAARKNVGTFIKPMASGGLPVHCRYNAAVSSNRTSADSPNVQNESHRFPIRKCLTARPSWTYISRDYKTAELRSLADVCYRHLGYSRLGDSLNAGNDPHVDFAGRKFGYSYEQASRLYQAKDAQMVGQRQATKILNFGVPGNLGEDSLIEQWASKGIVVSQQMAKAMIAAWHRAVPEVKELQRLVAAWLNSRDGVWVHPDTKLVRAWPRNVPSWRRRNAAQNSCFQTLTATYAKDAWFEATRACYDATRNSSLFGARIPFMIHDDLTLESPTTDAQQLAQQSSELDRIMVAHAQQTIPTVISLTDANIGTSMYKL